MLATIEIDTKYEGYVRRELERAARLRAQADFVIPEDTPFADFVTLSIEARDKLQRIRPRSLAQAGRIPGVSPADLQNLVMEVRKMASSRPADDDQGSLPAKEPRSAVVRFGSTVGRRGSAAPWASGRQHRQVPRAALFPRSAAVPRGTSASPAPERPAAEGLRPSRDPNPLPRDPKAPNVPRGTCRG